MLPSKRTSVLFGLAALLGIATSFFAGVMSWGYLEPSSRTGLWYYWLFVMPDNFTRLLPFTPSPGGRVLASMAGYACLYLAAILLSRRAWQRLQSAK